MSHLVPNSLSHLADSHLDYFRHWCQLLHLESLTIPARSTGGASGIWLQPANERSVVVVVVVVVVLIAAAAVYW